MKNVNRDAMNGNKSHTQRLDTAIHQPERQRRFLAAFAASGSVGRASRWARIHRQSHYFWLAADPSYPTRFRQAETQAARTLEDEAVRRAYEGLRKPVWYKGKIVGYETEYSDTLLLAVLKANNPDKFRDRVEQINLQDLDPDKLSPEMLDKIAEHLIAQALAGKSAGVVDEARRRIEAGEPVTVEGICREMGEPIEEEPKP
jgi:hypothetical protein